MLDDFHVVLMLADHAAVESGKLYIHGGGWQWIGLGGPSAIAMIIEVPWSKTNQKHSVELVLEDSDGGPVMGPTPDGTFSPIRVDGTVEVGRPAGIPEGTPLPVPLAFNIPPLPLMMGNRYVWRLSIDHISRDGWSLPFGVGQPMVSQSS